MGANGMVTVCSDLGVIFKIVVGCNGSEAKKVAHAVLEESGKLTTGSLDELAASLEFGCEDCRIVYGDMIHGLYRYNGETFFELPENVRTRYVDTFHNPRFNLRTKYGWLGHMWQVDIEDMTVKEWK